MKTAPQQARRRKVPEKVLPEFSRIELLPIHVATALFLDRESYELAMNGIGIRGENWHPWPEDGCAWVAAYVDGENKTGKHICVCLGATEGLDGIDIASTLCHEAVHVYQHFMDHIGERRPGEEQQAYMIGQISEYLMREYVRQGGKI